MIAEAEKLCGGACGRLLPRSCFSENSRRPDGLHNICRECNRQKTREWRLSNPAMALYQGARKRALDRTLTFDLTVDWFSQKLSAGVCEITGIPFDYGHMSLRRPSPDRIDSSLGYLQENTRMILWGLNAAKGHHSDEEFCKFLSDVSAAINEQTRTS